MPEPAALADHLAAERTVAVRLLLVRPLRDAEVDSDGFRLIVRHAVWLVDYFDKTCGWSLHIDAAGGFARLSKRAASYDPTRPLRRDRGRNAPFDRRRYELVCRVCAELVRHPVTTIGLLAAAVRAESGLDTSRYGERVAFVDALRTLASWGAVEATVGDVEAFASDERANAILTADTARLHRLLVTPISPSTLPEGLTVDEAVERLLLEPRYPSPAELADVEGDDEARNRWARHRLGRRALDDPVTHYDELSEIEAAYLGSLCGRAWLRERVAEAGLDLEERAEGFVAVDPDALATDQQFPAPLGNAHQLALLLADRLVVRGPDGSVTVGVLTATQLRAEVMAIFDRFPGWARGQREDGGVDRLGAEAVDLLRSFGLVIVGEDGSVAARPALTRYRVGAATVRSARPPTLFGDEE